MNYKMMGRFNALILALEGLFMFPALFICLFDGEGDIALSFVYSILIVFALALILFLVCKTAKRDFYASEGLICVGTSWIVMCLFGCLPFYLSGQIPSFIDALFESVSGFTTTGSTILTEIESLSRGILYWRSFSHWIGGMGVLVFVLAILPISGKNEGFTMHLLRAESPGPNVGKLVPKMRTTAAILYGTYIILTVLDFIFLMFGGMSLFESVCTALGTAGTGGFGVLNDSMASYSPYIQWVCTVFMFLFGINFTCFYLILIGQAKSVFKNEELRMYVLIVISCIVAITVNISNLYATLSESIRHASFQVVAIISSTGFGTADFNEWPTFSKSILFMLMIVGACAGSTGGGFKCMRILMLAKAMKRNISRVLHPKKVSTVRIDGQVVDEKVLANTSAYLAVYLAIILVSFLLLSFENFSLMTNLSAVVTCVNNIGPGFDLVGPSGNFASFSIFSKCVLIFDMLAGRLEIFPILVLFFRSAWVRRG